MKVKLSEIKSASKRVRQSWDVEKMAELVHSNIVSEERIRTIGLWGIEYALLPSEKGGRPKTTNTHVSSSRKQALSAIRMPRRCSRKRPRLTGMEVAFP